jgi:hypothetical protein
MEKSPLLDPCARRLTAAQPERDSSVAGTDQGYWRSLTGGRVPAGDWTV